MAAGLGSRFGGDKQIASLGPCGETLMEYSVFDAIRAGFERIIFVIRPGMRSEIISRFDSMLKSHAGIEFIFAEQTGGRYSSLISASRTKPLGTVHALLSAAEYLDSPFAVINADDYYGRHTFETVAKALECFTGSSDAAMVAYSLYNTLSRHGAVTRGICEVEKGCLKKISEAYNVYADDEGNIVEKSGEVLKILNGASPVSMNMWAFHNDLLTDIHEYFRSFVAALAPDDNISECLLPVMTGEFIVEGKINVAVYTTDGRWFGLTHKEDAIDAAWELDKRHQDGSYPERLF